MITQLKDPSDLTLNQVYPRRALHDAFKGQQQGGISTPKAFPIVMLRDGAISGPDDPEARFLANLIHTFGATHHIDDN